MQTKQGRKNLIYLLCLLGFVALYLNLYPLVALLFGCAILIGVLTDRTGD